MYLLSCKIWSCRFHVIKIEIAKVSIHRFNVLFRFCSTTQMFIPQCRKKQQSICRSLAYFQLLLKINPKQKSSIWNLIALNICSTVSNVNSFLIGGTAAKRECFTFWIVFPHFSACALVFLQTFDVFHSSWKISLYQRLKDSTSAQTASISIFFQECNLFW